MKISKNISKNRHFSITRIAISIALFLGNAAATFDLLDPFGSYFDPVGWLNDQFYYYVFPEIRSHRAVAVQSFWYTEESLGCPTCKVVSWAI